jgi:hypothetical protein
MLAAAGAGLTQVYKEMGHVALGAIPKPGEVKRDKPPPGPEEVAVHNRASILRDHNSYHANDVQVLARIASAAADAAGHGALWDGEPRRELLAAAERRHVTAVRLLGAARIVNALAALLVAGWLAAEGIAATGFAWAGRVAGSFNTDFKSWFERVPGASVGDAVRLALLAALLFAVWHGLTSSAWASWRRGELQRATGQSNRRWSPAAIPFAALLALSVAASALALERLLHRSNDPDHLKAGLIVAGIELLMVGWSWFGFRPRSVPAGPFGDDEGAPAGGDEPARAAPAQV